MYVMANRNDPNPKGLLSDDFKDTKKSRKPKLVTNSQSAPLSNFSCSNQNQKTKTKQSNTKQKLV